MFALFKEDRRVGKAHHTHDAALMEAVDVGTVDYDPHRGWFLKDGYEIRET